MVANKIQSLSGISWRLHVFDSQAGDRRDGGIIQHRQQVFGNRPFLVLAAL